MTMSSHLSREKWADALDTVIEMINGEKEGHAVTRLTLYAHRLLDDYDQLKSRCDAKVVDLVSTRVVARDAVFRILADLRDRKGLRWEFDGMDRSLKKEMIDAWTDAVNSAIRGNPKTTAEEMTAKYLEEIVGEL